ncbi:hypothetical protein [Streptomyces sp. NBC_00996]|uniref:hypothetical protein n=1 Tax=Streptomyces sp. NBC_00996 TaxID=2903710 RepID=UPI00386BD81C|nr:hypothetical protein OG390_18195 [Streptomyces sp. NBC_00996]
MLSATKRLGSRSSSLRSPGSSRTPGVQVPVGAVAGVAVEGDAQPGGRLPEGVGDAGHLPRQHHEGATDFDPVQRELRHRPQLVEQPDGVADSGSGPRSAPGAGSDSG